MKIILLLLPAVFLGACNTTAPIYLQHPQTGQTVTCGPYNYDPVTANVMSQREARCITDFQRQGYERVSGS